MGNKPIRIQDLNCHPRFGCNPRRKKVKIKKSNSGFDFGTVKHWNIERNDVTDFDDVMAGYSEAIKQIAISSPIGQYFEPIRDK